MSATALASKRHHERADRCTQLHYHFEMNARRESWARVAAGSAGSHQSTRSAAFAHSLNNSASTSHPNRLSRSIDADGHDRNNNMSTSWGQGPRAPSYPGQTGYWQGLGGSAQDIPPFFVPSYLRASKHAEKLQEAHKVKLAAQRDYRPHHASSACPRTWPIFRHPQVPAG